jgi:hypothetical protein
MSLFPESSGSNEQSQANRVNLFTTCGKAWESALAASASPTPRATNVSLFNGNAFGPSPQANLPVYPPEAATQESSAPRGPGVSAVNGNPFFKPSVNSPWTLPPGLTAPAQQHPRVSSNVSLFNGNGLDVAPSANPSMTSSDTATPAPPAVPTYTLTPAEELAILDFAVTAWPHVSSS